MVIDRYVKIVLTIIAVELFWIGARDIASPVSAQAQPQPQSVILRGIQLNGVEAGVLPVIAARPLRVEEARPLKVEIDDPISIVSERPLLVENVGYTPTPVPR